MSAEPQPASRSFGKYELLSRIARGGMGEVYLASLRGELGFEKKLVVKTIRPELAQNPKFVDLFAAEAKTAVALTHGNIVPIYELGRSDETLYIAMGHVDGPSVSQLLRQHVSRETPVDPGTALFIVREVLTGLAYAHRREQDRAPVVHRDISPRNILIDRSGQVRIVDFGIALPAEVQVAVSAGSSGYMAPEQARAAAADPNADVFSTACVLYELLTLEKAFPAPGVWADPTLERVPTPLRRLLGRALSLDPAQRPVDAGAFLRELNPTLAELAPTYTTQDLAEHLRDCFPSGWDHAASEPAVSGTPATPASLRTETFATRLTAVEPEPTDSKPATTDSRPATPLPAPALPAPTSSRAGAWIGTGVAVALLGALAFSQFGRKQPAEVVSEGADPRPPSSDPGGEPPPSPDRPAPPDQVELQPFVLEIEPDAPHPVVMAGDVAVDGPPFVLEPPASGSTQVTIEAPGFRPRSFELMPDDRGRRGTKIALEPLLDGAVDVFAPSVNYAYVFIDGAKLRKTTPVTGHKLPEGKHRVRVVCPAEVCGSERKLVDKRITIEPRKTIKITAED